MLMSVMQLLLGLNFMGLSFLALAGANYTTRKLAQLGLPKYFRYVTGLVQLVGGSMLYLGVLWHATFSLTGGAWVTMILAVGLLSRTEAKDSWLSMLPAIIIGISALAIAISAII